MFTLIICVGLLSVTTDVVRSKAIDLPTVSDGLTVNKVIRTWDEAHQQCQSEGAVLASPINAEFLNAMKSLIGPNNTAYFIGTKANHFRESFTSVEGIPFENMTAASEMVQTFDPRDGGCLSMDRYIIRVVSCCERLPFMCYNAQINNSHVTTDKTEEQKVVEEYVMINEECRTNDTEYKYYESTGSCYKLHKHELTWHAASFRCQKEGAHLMVINDENEANIIRTMNIRVYFPYTFIGLRDFTKKGVWESVDGKPLAELYSQWENGSPITNAKGLCGTILSSGVLHNGDCNYKRQYVCEKEIGSKA